MRLVAPSGLHGMAFGFTKAEKQGLRCGSVTYSNGFQKEHGRNYLAKHAATAVLMLLPLLAELARTRVKPG